MTVARNQIVDVQTTRYYHYISKVVRGAFLIGDGYEHRKRWVEKRLKLLANNDAVSDYGFALLSAQRKATMKTTPPHHTSCSS
jgi:hypothetical protein